MTPIIFINCSHSPFIDDIISGRKIYETRTRNTLGRLLGHRVMIAETGRGGRPVVRCTAEIVAVVKIKDPAAWFWFRKPACIDPGSQYDWKPETRCKWLYKLADVEQVPEPFSPPEDVRHGRAWMEYHEQSAAAPKEE